METPSRELTYAQAIHEALAMAMEADDRVFLLGEDIGVYGGAFQVTGDQINRFGAAVLRLRDAGDGADRQSGCEASFYAGRGGLRAHGRTPTVRVRNRRGCAAQPSAPGLAGACSRPQSRRAEYAARCQGTDACGNRRPRSRDGV